MGIWGVHPIDPLGRRQYDLDAVSEPEHPGTVREIRRINPSAKLIVMSGLDVGQELKSSVDGFLAKPYSASDLARMVRDVLDESVSVT